MKLKKRLSVTATSVVVAGVAVLGAGGTASAATPDFAHVQRPAVSVKATDHRWDHGVSYLIEQGYCWDGARGWHHNDRVIDSARYARDGQFYRWDDTECGWKFDRSYWYHWNRYEHDGRDWNHHNRNHSDH